MRVIAGTCRGHRLVAPLGDRVRPTLDRVREALFNILAPEIVGAAFLDLFAGSGANGIEALSRGAAAVCFVDSHPQSLACVRKNLENTRLADRATVLNCRLPRDLRRVSGAFDVIFADPPYDYQDHDALLGAVADRALLRAGGQLIVEHTRKIELPETMGPLSRSQQRHYASTTLSFYS